MNASRTTTAPSPSAPSAAQRIGRRLGGAVALLPFGLFALLAELGGQSGSARRVLRADPGTSSPRVLTQALLTVLLGVLALILAGILALGIARGLFYGFVDSGPYDDSWGGPSKTGAWLAHFGVSVPICVAAVGLLYGLAALHRRMTAPLRGERRPVWVLPTVALSCAAAVLFLVAFAHQLN
ncbi:hypothetical protein AB0939_26810 [Streptomyces sp. NPDC006990]|uniref:hypothetical protein n=1 Tax=Streptomyces sp. NPDC006990 TaxID=3154481 RepID=UPI00345392A6